MILEKEGWQILVPDLQKYAKATGLSQHRANPVQFLTEL